MRAFLEKLPVKTVKCGKYYRLTVPVRTVRHYRIAGKSVYVEITRGGALLLGWTASIAKSGKTYYVCIPRQTVLEHKLAGKFVELTVSE